MGEYVGSEVQVNGKNESLRDYIQNLEAVIEAFPDCQWDLRHLLVRGGYVAAHFVDTGTHNGTFSGKPPTGRVVTTHEFAFYRVVDNRIVEVWVTADRLGVLQQLG